MSKQDTLPDVIQVIRVADQHPAGPVHATQSQDGLQLSVNASRGSRKLSVESNVSTVPGTTTASSFDDASEDTAQSRGRPRKLTELVRTHKEKISSLAEFLKKHDNLLELYNEEKINISELPVSKWTLSFKSRVLERAFDSRQRLDVSRAHRKIFIISAIFTCIVGPIIFRSAPSFLPPAIITLCTFIPLYIFLIAVSYKPEFYMKYHPVMLPTALTIMFITLMVIGQFGFLQDEDDPEPEKHAGSTPAFILFFGLYVSSGMRFVPVSLVGIMWVFIHLGMGFVSPQKEFARELFSWALFYLLMCFIGMTYAYISELEQRTRFLNRRALVARADRMRHEHTQSNRLLSNLFPESVVERLLQGHADVLETYREVAVAYVRFEGCDISRTSSSFGPFQLLANVVASFDSLCKESKVEKVKANRTTFLLAVGLDDTDEQPSQRMATFLLSLLADYDNQSSPLRSSMLALEKELGEAITMKIALHRGPVVAGVIGRSTVQFDVWGETVNTTMSILERTAPNHIYCSPSATAQLSDKFIFEDHYVKGGSKDNPFDQHIEQLGILKAQKVTANVDAAQMPLLLSDEDNSSETSYDEEAGVAGVMDITLEIFDEAKNTNELITALGGVYQQEVATGPADASGESKSDAPLMIEDEETATLGSLFKDFLAGKKLQWDQATWDRYKVYACATYVRFLQVHLALGFVIFLVFGTVDFVIFPEIDLLYPFLEFFALAPMMLWGMMALSLLRLYPKMYEPIVLSLIVLMGVTIAAMFPPLPDELVFWFKHKIITATAFSFTYTVIHPWYLTLSWGFLSFINVGLLFTRDVSLSALGSILCLFCVAATSSHLMSKSLRTQFVMTERVAIRNAFLEHQERLVVILLESCAPREVISRLRVQGAGVVHVDTYPNATVMFCRLNFRDRFPNQGAPNIPLLVNLRSTFFATFAELVQEKEMAKLKTAGDSFVCVAGVPQPHSDGVVRTLSILFEFLEQVGDLMSQLFEIGEHRFTASLTVGIGSGPVVGGVLGEEKWAFDCWGECVDNAAYLEATNVMEDVARIDERTHALLIQSSLADQVMITPGPPMTRGNSGVADGQSFLVQPIASIAPGTATLTDSSILYSG